MSRIRGGGVPDETFGEDPYLVTQMGVNYIQGMQGEHKEGTACIAKHFLGYSETQGGMNCTAARINDQRAVRSLCDTI